MKPRLLALTLWCLPAAALAEAGFAPTFCAEPSCACGNTVCGCGQTCLGGSSCVDAPQYSFCSVDAQCAGSCGTFICEFNVCRARDGGVPDAGSTEDAGVPDAGATPDAGPSKDAGSTNDAGPETPTPQPGGCAVAPVGALMVLALWLARRV